MLLINDLHFGGTWHFGFSKNLKSSFFPNSKQTNWEKLHGTNVETILPNEENDLDNVTNLDSRNLDDEVGIWVKKVENQKVKLSTMIMLILTEKNQEEGFRLVCGSP